MTFSEKIAIKCLETSGGFMCSKESPCPAFKSAKFEPSYQAKHRPYKRFGVYDYRGNPYGGGKDDLPMCSNHVATRAGFGCISTPVMSND